MGGKSGPRGRGAPIVFFTKVRKVEPIGGDCIHVYCSVITDGEWEDRVIIEIPIVSAIENSEFVSEAAKDIMRETKLIPVEIKLVH